MRWILAAVALTGIWIASNIWSLCKNYLSARRFGLVVFVSPANPSNIFHMIFSPALRPILQRILPVKAFQRLQPTLYGWEFADKHELHARIGPVFVLVNPGGNELWIADPNVAYEVLTRRKDFVQLEIATLIMGFLGPNLITSDGEVWQRQRKLVAPNLNERISAIVWDESSKQAEQMLDHLLDQPDGECNETVDGLRLIAMHVLGRAGYGQPQSWKTKESKSATTTPTKMTYFEAISWVIYFLVPAALLPSRFFRLPLMPRSLRTLGTALQELPAYTKEMLDTERQLSSSEGSRQNLMSMLVRVSDDSKDEEKQDVTSHKAQHLTEEEISGNLFLFTAAGFDTTANSMAYAVALLAAYPETQEWIIEELDSVLAEHKTTETLDYASIFPKLTRCLALMFETLRLYPPLVHISRGTVAPQTLTTTDPTSSTTSTHHIPAHTKIYVNVAALHSDPKTWGSDALTFRPARWLHPTETGLMSMPKGAFLPWSYGPRVCPGQKMSQVEFIAVLVTLFRRCRVEVVPRERVSRNETETKKQSRNETKTQSRNETETKTETESESEKKKSAKEMEDARHRLLEIMQDSQSRLTLQMNRPGDVRLRWVRR